MFVNAKPTFKDWLKWAKKTKIDPVVIAYVKKNGIQSARLALHLKQLSNIATDMYKHPTIINYVQPSKKVIKDFKIIDEMLFIGGAYNA